MSRWSQQVSEGAVLLTANQRLSRHHMEQYQRWQLASGNAWWDTPSILPLRSWLSALHRQAISLGLSDRSLTPKLLVQRAWRDIIDADTSVQLLDAAGAARAALSAWELSCAWQCVNNEEHYLSVDQYTWQRWMHRYRQWLDQRMGIDESLLADEIMQVISGANDAQSEALLPNTLILEGFVQLPSQLEALIAALQSKGVEVVIAKAPAEAVVHKVVHDDDEAELLSIAAHMRSELEVDSNQSLGLVVPDLAKRRDAVVRAFERVFYPAMSPAEIARQPVAYEISLGAALSDQPVVAAALKLLQLTGSTIEGSDISAVLLSPYWCHAKVDQRHRENQDRRWRDKRVRRLSVQQFAKALDKGGRLGPALNELIEKRDLQKTTLGEWATRFSLWLRVLGWPGESRNSVEYQGFSAWYECLDDMQLLDDGRRVNFNAALSQLTNLAQLRVFQAESATAPIQVLGRLESHGMPFDCLWVAGLDSDQWPPTASPNAFLTIEAQKQCAIPASSAAQQLKLAEGEYAMWASQAPVLFVSSVSSREGSEVVSAALPNITSSEKNQRQSAAFLERLDSVKSTATDLIELISNAVSCEQVIDDRGPGLTPGTKVGGGARLFENQALCPFKAFALHRLSIRPLEEVGIGLDPRQHGTLLHTALEEFWRTTKTHAALMELDEQQLQERLQDIVSQCIADQKVPNELQALEKTRLVPLLFHWIMQMEVPREPFEVLEVERKLSIEHGGIQMDIIIDRIDKVADNLVVIDYKTGVSSRIAPWAESRISNPQLPLYVLTDDNIGAASFAQVAINQHMFIGIAHEDGMLPNVYTKLKAAKSASDAQAELTQWDQWRAHWQNSLDAIACEIRQGVATVTPMKNACTYCDLKALCRIDTNSVEQSDESAVVEAQS